MMLLMSNPKRYSCMVEFLDQVSLNLSELSWKDCELIAKQISQENQSTFCSGIHQGIADQLEEQTNNPEKLNAALRFASKLNKDSRSIQPADIRKLQDIGWQDQSIEDMVALVAIVNCFNILANGLGFGAVPKEAFAQMGQATIANKGNLSTFHAFLQSA